MELARRVVFALIILAIAAGLYSFSRQDAKPYGLSQLLKGEKVPEDLDSKLDPDDARTLMRMNDAFAKLAESVLPSVVSITTRTVRPPQVTLHPLLGLIAGKAQVIPGLGSGAIISKDGMVVTNYHVVADVSELVITTNDNQVYNAQLLGTDEERDIALLRIESDKKDFPALSFGDSDKVKVGQMVFAVGNPFGLSGTVTQGIISARDRHLSDSQLSYLQTDTVINPGNSGGPLVNIRGEMLGINVAIYRGDESVRAWQGVGLAVPSNDAKAVIDAILSESKGGNSGYLGLELSSESVAIDASLGTSTTGAYITDLDANSPAALAGLVPGDVVTALNEKPFRNPRELLSEIRQLAPGSKATLTVFRNGQIVVVPVTVGQRPDMQ